MLPSTCGAVNGAQWGQWGMPEFDVPQKHVVVGWVALGPGSLAPWLPGSCESSALGPGALSVGRYAGRGLLPPGQSGERLGSWGPWKTVCILLWRIMISPSSPPLAVPYHCCYCGSLWEQTTETSNWISFIPLQPWPAFRCPTSDVHVLVPVPAPCSNLRSSIGHVAGWTRPYSRPCRIAATLTGLQDPKLSCWCLGRGRECSLIHSLAQSLSPGSGAQGFDAGCLSHWAKSSTCLASLGRQTSSPVHTGHAVPHTERHDHSQPRNRTSRQPEGPGPEPISSIPMPCHAIA